MGMDSTHQKSLTHSLSLPETFTPGPILYAYLDGWSEEHLLEHRSRYCEYVPSYHLCVTCSPPHPACIGPKPCFVQRRKCVELRPDFWLPLAALLSPLFRRDLLMPAIVIPIGSNSTNQWIVIECGPFPSLRTYWCSLHDNNISLFSIQTYMIYADCAYICRVNKYMYVCM